MRMLEVQYHADSLFQMIVDSGTYHKVYKFEPDDYDENPDIRAFNDSWYDLFGKLEEFLIPAFGHHVFVSEHTAATRASTNVWADRIVVESDLATISNDLTNCVLSFLREKAPLHAVIIAVQQDMEIAGSKDLGQMIVTLTRCGVTKGLRGIFESKFRRQLLYDEGMLMLSFEDTWKPRPDASFHVAGMRRAPNLIEVQFEVEEFLCSNLPSYAKIQEPSPDDPALEKFHALQARRKDELSEILSAYGSRLVLGDNDRPINLINILVLEENFSDELIKIILPFLRRYDDPQGRLIGSTVPSYAVLFTIFDGKASEHSSSKGNVVVASDRIGVSGHLKEMFKKRCRKSLHLDEWPIKFDGNKAVYLETRDLREDGGSFPAACQGT